jgi:hypothetical protein
MALQYECRTCSVASTNPEAEICSRHAPFVQERSTSAISWIQFREIHDRDISARSWPFTLPAIIHTRILRGCGPDARLRERAQRLKPAAALGWLAGEVRLRSALLRLGRWPRCLRAMQGHAFVAHHLLQWAAGLPASLEKGKSCPVDTADTAAGFARVAPGLVSSKTNSPSPCAALSTCERASGLACQHFTHPRSFEHMRARKKRILMSTQARHKFWHGDRSVEVKRKVPSRSPHQI